MTKEEFFSELQELLEIESEQLNEETNLKNVPEYDSLSILSIIAYIDEHFQKKLTTQQLNNISTGKDLIELIGIDFFN